MPDSDTIVIKAPTGTKARWVHQSQSEGRKLSDWVFDRVEAQPGSSNARQAVPAPTPEAVRAARAAAGLTQAAAAALVHLGEAMRWSEYERGVRTIDTARWELFLVKTGLRR